MLIIKRKSRLFPQLNLKIYLVIKQPISPQSRLHLLIRVRKSCYASLSSFTKQELRNKRLKAHQIPAQCPPFPSPHTYKQTPVFPKREQDFFRTRMHKAEQSRQAEENLQRLISGPQFDRSTLISTANNGSVNGSPVETAQAMAVDQQATAKRNACKRILQLFPPANFRDISKRSRLAEFIK
ncbi:hypothetical protein BX667DRAFT_261364 [Coemansia mojavensis]|nr:hypothetical protein BX667DRAFT_261364 [Coemansia mojavensis]